MASVGLDGPVASWSPPQRLMALQERYALSDSTLAAWCRERGLFEHQIKQWREEFCTPAVPASREASVAFRQRQHEQLQRELRAPRKRHWPRRLRCGWLYRMLRQEVNWPIDGWSVCRKSAASHGLWLQGSPIRFFVGTTVHCDNGPPMKGQTMLAMMQRLAAKAVFGSFFQLKNV